MTITISPQEVQILTNLLSRTGVNPIEAIWANNFLDKLRALAVVPVSTREQVQAQMKSSSPVEPGKDAPGGPEEGGS